MSNGRFGSIEEFYDAHPAMKERKAEKSLAKTFVPPNRSKPKGERKAKSKPKGLWVPMVQPHSLFDDQDKRIVRLILPFPPSVNMAFPTNKFGRRYKSSRYQHFYTLVRGDRKTRGILEDWKEPILRGKLKVTMKLFRPKNSGDIDNYNKCVFDTLKGKVFVDDDQIIQLVIFREDDKLKPRVELWFEELF